MINPVMPVYKRSSIAFERGQDVYLYDLHGRQYLDFASGIGVNALGYSHPELVAVMLEQGRKLWHVSNLYTIPELDEFAANLVSKTFADTVFFGNSGTEAVECAIKITRKYHDHKNRPDKYRIITFSKSYHGRTMAALSASDREGCMNGFEPSVDGFDLAIWHDLASVQALVNKNTAGIMIEPIQGEGGIRVASVEFMIALRALCDEHDLLLICDEVQSGMGRTGELFAYLHSGITPDIVTAAKALGCGFPLGACLATEKAASCMDYGSHGSTYGGNPLAMKIGQTVLNIISDPHFLQQVVVQGEYLLHKLLDLAASYPNLISEVRGRGLMLAIKMTRDVKQVASELRELGLLTVPAGDNVLRIFPPLIVRRENIDEGVAILESYFSM